jgi:terminase small subunit / prophage DNA-packing protein
MATQAEIAAHLDLTDRWVRKLVNGGKLPSSEGRGGYDLDACRLAYIRYLRGVASGQTKEQKSDDEENPNGEKDYSAELEKEKWREKRRENDIAESLVAPVSVLTDALEKVADQVVPILDSIPLEMKRLNPKLTGHDIQTVKKAIARARNAVADVTIEVETE